ncbi:ABC transporter permease [Chryseolinea soli]|uniref:FtsX-like permease family protein n=1 Tax=Chryseolinea soli TaxID=2321403 RepID=A0A385STQ0_9BACT|nr:FtsX-like permease family protein [Chryseolinea soli]AYB32188.1 FtsX-like permease family protein [Chryseolinea soli]
MLTNYLKIAIRSLLHNKIYSFINIIGLSIGMTASILILIFVVHEYRYDRFHEKGDRIFRAEKQFSRDGRYSLYANPEFGPTMMQTDPKVINYVRTYSMGRKVVKTDNTHKFFEDRFLFADTSFFSIFSFPLIQGQRSALARPLTVIITEQTASRYFGNANPIGKFITLDANYTFEVTGVAKNPPSHSSVQFDFIASYPSLLTMPNERNIILNNSSGFPTYLLLADANAIAGVRQSILKTTYTNDHITYSLQPLFANHFNLNFGDVANTRYVFIFLCVALLILALALINYMNLTTARATVRAKEIGVRKVIGASRKTLSFQFYLESALTTVVAFVLAIALIQIFKPIFLNVLQQNIDTTFLTSPVFLSVVAGLLFVCVLLAGSYPALVLPQFKPVEVLNGKFSSANQGSGIRKLLTIFQFTVSIALAICTLVMNHQLQYLQSKSTGLERDQVMVIPVEQFSNAGLTGLKNDLQRQTGVEGLAMASVPLYRSTLPGLSMVTSPASQEKVGLKWIMADESFFAVLGITWHQKPETTKLEGNHVINQSAAEALGMVNLSGGDDLTMGGDHVPAVTGKILGMVNDFNYETLRSPIQPLIVSVVADTLLAKNESPSLYLRIDTHSALPDKIAAIKKSYETYANDTPFTYYFLDDAFNDLQKGETRLSKIFTVFTGISLCIACLGLFGLVTFSAENRTKEISIRKVLGASMANILMLLSSELILLLLLSIAIGVPVAWFSMKDWLSQFYYQTSIPLSSFLVPGVAVIVISLLVIWAKAIRVALEDPSKNLKSE